jgi:WD40 repeat protein
VRAGSRIAGAALALALAAGCARPGVRLDDLPASPVGIVYRPESLALDRVDALEDLEKRGAPPEEGVARLENLDAAWGGEPELERRLQRFRGSPALLDPRTGEVHPLENAPSAARPLDWSPDRRELLLVGRWRETAQLFIWDRESHGVEIVTSGPAEHPLGCLGPGGRVVAVEVKTSGAVRGARLVTRPPGSGAFEPLTSGPWDIQPACSPDGRHVAFSTIAAGGQGGTSIAVLDLEQPDAPARIVARGLDPAFSPDGEWIVYTGATGKGRRLWRVRWDGAGKTLLAPSTHDEFDPAVSPDGVYVAYVMNDRRRDRLWVRRFDGSGARPLLGNGDGLGPVW